MDFDWDPSDFGAVDYGDFEEEFEYDPVDFMFDTEDIFCADTFADSGEDFGLEEIVDEVIEPKSKGQNDSGNSKKTVKVQQKQKKENGANQEKMNEDQNQNGSGSTTSAPMENSKTQQVMTKGKQRKKKPRGKKNVKIGTDDKQLESTDQTKIGLDSADGAIAENDLKNQVKPKKKWKKSKKAKRSKSKKKKKNVDKDVDTAKIPSDESITKIVMDSQAGGITTSQINVPYNSFQLKNRLLKLLSDEVQDFRKYRTAGNKIFDELSKLINKKHPTVKISRRIIAGSIGKNTCLGQNFEPDYDVVLFVRGVAADGESLQPFLDEIHKIMVENLPLECEKWTGCSFTHELLTIRRKKHGLELKFPVDINSKQVTIKFDLHLAYDFSSNIDEQAQKTLEKIKESKNPQENWYLYSSSLSEKTVQFVRNNSSYVRNVIRLAKLWDKRFLSNAFISGRSSFIELVAMQAAKEAGDNILKAYRRFLEIISNFDEIHINFFDSSQHPTPFVLDSVNPFNNYAEAITPELREEFKSRATDTLTALGECEFSKDYKGTVGKVLSFFARGIRKDEETEV